MLSSLGKRFGLAFKKKLQFNTPERAALLFTPTPSKPRRTRRSKTFQPTRRYEIFEIKAKKVTSAKHLKVGLQLPEPEPFVAVEVKTGR